MTQAPTRCALLCAGLLLTVGSAQATDTPFSPKPVTYGWQGAGNYITGKQLAGVEQHIRSHAPVNADSNRAFQKALCTVDLAKHSYRETNTKGITEHLAGEALALSAAAQQNANPGQMAPLPGTPRLYADHWFQIASLKQAAEGKQCAVTQLECAEVALAGAEYETREGYGRHRNHGVAWLKQAEQLLAEGEVAVAACTEPAAASSEAETFSLDTDTLFAFGSARLSTNGQQRIHAFAQRLQAYQYRISALQISGHADRIGSASANRKLSAQRAEAVAAILRQHLSAVPAERIHTIGKGSSEPLVQCTGNKPTAALKSCLQPNRRVTVTVTGVSS